MMIAAAVIGAALYALLPVGHRVSADDRLHARPAASAIAANVEVAAESKDATARGVSQPEGRRAAADDGLVTSALGRSQPLASPNVPPEPTTLPDNQSGNLVEQRLAATRHWLASANPNAFTIQLMEAEHEPQLVRELNDMAKSVELAEIFLYRSGAHRKASLSVLYGNFSDRRAAQDALDKLPPALKANRPFLRTVEAIRAEIRQHQQAS
jgi:DamX protein